MSAGLLISHRRWLTLLTGCWFSICLWASPTLSADPPESATESAESQDEPTSAAPAGPQRKPIDPGLKIWLKQALLMLLGIILSGILLLLFAILWGNRARRLARKPLPAVSKPDELWFLKPKPDAAQDHPPDESETSSDA
ncbi:MAG: hypothetical protein JSS02_20795 [Planctomycetes bacterium]|nr:hypothetical protein [Planctomycetota bacterium]